MLLYGEMAINEKTEVRLGICCSYFRLSKV